MFSPARIAVPFTIHTYFQSLPQGLGNRTDEGVPFAVQPDAFIADRMTLATNQ